MREINEMNELNEFKELNWSKKKQSSSTYIHPTARVHPWARIGQGVQIGAYTIIGEDVEIGDGTVIGSHCVIEGTTIIGKNNRIFPGAILGMEPQDLKYNGEKTRVVIGDSNTIREYVTIRRGTVASGETRVGNGNLLMAYSHVAHDCQLGNNIIMANSTALAGHVIVEDKAVISGLVGVHQFVKIGRMAMVGGCSKVTKDVPPYIMVDGHPAAARGLNMVGIRRNNIDREVKSALKKMYRLIYKSGLNLTQALNEIEKELGELIENHEELAHFITFVRQSERGICGG